VHGVASPDDRTLLLGKLGELQLAQASTPVKASSGPASPAGGAPSAAAPSVAAKPPLPTIPSQPSVVSASSSVQVLSPSDSDRTLRRDELAAALQSKPASVAVSDGALKDSDSGVLSEAGSGSAKADTPAKTPGKLSTAAVLASMVSVRASREPGLT
jgi:hypothetical protein